LGFLGGSLEVLGDPWEVIGGPWGVVGELLGGLRGDLVGDLGPHVLRTPMFQRFASFSAECVLGGSLGRTRACLWTPEGFLVGPWGVLGVAGGSLETPWGPWLLLGSHWATPWGFLGCPWGVLVGDLVPHMLRTPMFQRFLCFCLSDRIYVRFWVSDRFFGFLGASLGLLRDPLRHLGGPWLLLGSPWATPWGFLGGPWGVLVRT